MIGFPPGTTTTFWPLTRMPRDVEMYDGDGLAEIREARRRPVAGPALIERALGGVLDVGRRRKVRLADFEMNDVLALRLERAGTLEDFERGLDPDPRHSFGDLHALYYLVEAASPGSMRISAASFSSVSTYR